MKYIINNENIVINRVIGNPQLSGGDFVVIGESDFGSLGDFYSHDRCYPLTEGPWLTLNKLTLEYDYNDSDIDKAKASVFSQIEGYNEDQNAKPFEYPEGSGDHYKVTDALLKTLQRGVGLASSDPIPCNNGNWDLNNSATGSAFTMEELQELYNFGYDIPESNYTNTKMHIANVMELTTTKSVIEYDYQTGWK